MIKRRVFLTIFAVAALSASVPSFSMEVINKKEDIFGAIEKGDLQTVNRIVLSELIDATCINREGQTPLNFACRLNKLDIVKRLIRDEKENKEHLINLFKSCLDVGDEYSKTPIWWACKNGNIEILKLLLANGASINNFTSRDARENGYNWRCPRFDFSEDFFQTTPFWWACKNGNVEMVKLLLTYGANSWSVNEYAYTYGPENVGMTPFHVACEIGSAEIVMLLLKKGVDVNKPVFSREDYYTPLYIACNKGYIKIVDLLLSYGAEIHAKHIMEASEKPEILRSLKLCLKYRDLVRRFGKAQDKVKFVLDERKDKESFASLVKLVFNRLLTNFGEKTEFEENSFSLKSIEATTFGKLYKKLENDELKEIFGVSRSDDIFKFIREVAKNDIHFDIKMIDEIIFRNNLLKKVEKKKFVDCCVKTVN